jgi:hypothetical protein
MRQLWPERKDTSRSPERPPMRTPMVFSLRFTARTVPQANPRPSPESPSEGWLPKRTGASAGSHQPAATLRVFATCIAVPATRRKAAVLCAPLSAA